MKKSELFFSAVAVPLDYLALILAAVVSYQIRYWQFIRDIRPIIFDLKFQGFITLVFFIAILWIIIFALSGLYSVKGTKNFFKEFVKIFIACSSGIAIVMIVMFFSRYLFESRFIIIASWIFSIIFVSLGRAVLWNIQRALYRKGIGVHRVIFIGNGAIADKLNNEFCKNKKLGYRVIASYFEFNEEVKNKLIEGARQDTYDEIIQTDPNMTREVTLEIVGLANEYQRDFKYAADLFGTKVSNFDIQTYSEIPIVEIKRTPLDGWGRIIKRFLDIILSLLLIIMFSPLMILSAIAIKIDSRGPVLFKYKRVGEKGRVIDFIKFRTMIKNAHQLKFDKDFLAKQENLREGTPMFKLKNDPRITKIGKILRRWSIDELPQFFLVIIGKMSLVGPRPHEIEEVAQYDKYQKRVLTIKPGITGLAQVSGRSDLDFNEEIKLDNYYIENWSLIQDVQIILQTPAAIFNKRHTL